MNEKLIKNLVDDLMNTEFFKTTMLPFILKEANSEEAESLIGKTPEIKEEYIRDYLIRNYKRLFKGEENGQRRNI
ncbi:hypothetical protein [Mesobacillus maritimus]|uniref:hypothetical protein n=1 Tax=Mesobacillus maritimus TaxID=1643336 RepID=UPI00384E951A